MAPNIFFEQMAAHDNFATTDLSSLQVVLTGGSAVSRELLTAYRSRGVPMTETCGMTEASALGITVAPADAERKMGCAGTAGPWTRVAIVDPDFNELPRGEIGELTIKGPEVMLGYWKNPAANAERLRDGWYRSGDLATMDDDGYVKHTGRSNDMIKSGGLNIYPAELERLLLGLDQIVQVAVVGVPDQKWGETPMVVAFTNGKPLSGDEVLAALEGRLAKYKHPRYLRVADQPLPTSLLGKVTKGPIKDQLQALDDLTPYRIR
jgi:fatty-acyl-CoA synthase